MQNSLQQYLGAADGAGKIMAHATRLLKLARLYQEIAPSHLCQASTLANYKSGIIVIHASNGAVAAKLRQMAPTLAEHFSQRGVECNGVQVKVQAHENSTQSTPSVQKPLTAKACGVLTGLRDALPQGDLRAALDTLLVRSAKTE